MQSRASIIVGIRVSIIVRIRISIIVRIRIRVRDLRWIASSAHRFGSVFVSLCVSRYCIFAQFTSGAFRPSADT